MTPFKQIEEMKTVIEQQKQVCDTAATMTITEHLEAMLNFLDVLQASLENAEYRYDISPIEQEIHSLRDYHITEKQLNNDVLIFQPIAIGEAELSAIDMESLSNALTQLKQTGKVDEDILILPPNINVFRAKLVEEDFD